ncbi:hypothetical protein KIPB_004599 [Kipferlia bialata]|uniref:DH domain-containing protein n=1 Tax=Kipferlia bialata TaxID=797122 RepID=A0A9K3CUR1_9EUKA|nr:hypothetical protein KIPB_004599 [Kipferlia bialata]|eukprot:g4599.t1
MPEEHYGSSTLSAMCPGIPPGLARVVVPAVIGLCDGSNTDPQHLSLRPLALSVSQQLDGLSLGVSEVHVMSVLDQHLFLVGQCQGGGGCHSDLVSALLSDRPYTPIADSGEDITTRCQVIRVLWPCIQALLSSVSRLCPSHTNDALTDAPDACLRYPSEGGAHHMAPEEYGDTWERGSQPVCLYNEANRTLHLARLAAISSQLLSMTLRYNTMQMQPRAMSLAAALQVSETLLIQQDLCSEDGVQYQEALHVWTQATAPVLSLFMKQRGSRSHPIRPLMVLLGARGVGKTWQAAAFALQTARDKHLATVPYYVSLRHPLRDTLLSCFGVSEPGALAKCICSMASRGKGLLLILDGLQEVQGEEQRHETISWVLQLLKSAPPTTRVLLTSTRETWHECIGAGVSLYRPVVEALTFRASPCQDDPSTTTLPHMSRTEIQEGLSRYGLPCVLTSTVTELGGSPSLLGVLSRHMSGVDAMPSDTTSMSLAVFEGLGLTPEVLSECVYPLFKCLGYGTDGRVSDCDLVGLRSLPGWSTVTNSGLLCRVSETVHTLRHQYRPFAQVLMHNLDGKTEHRQMLVAELLKTEVTFNQRLWELRRRLTELSLGLKGARKETAELGRYTRNLNIIQEVSDGFIRDLEAMGATPATLGDVLNSNAASICMYKPYIAQLAACHRYLAGRRVSRALKAVRVESVGGDPEPWPTSALLVEPAQRTMRYHLLASEYRKCLPPNHHEIVSMDKAVCVLSQMAQGVNETERQVDGKTGLRTLCQTLTGQGSKELAVLLLQPHRTVVAEMEMEVETGIQGTGSNLHRVYLLNDMVLVMGPVDTTEAHTCVVRSSLGEVEIEMAGPGGAPTLLRLRVSGLSLSTVSAYSAGVWAPRVMAAVTAQQDR